MTNLRRKEGKPVNYIHMELGRKGKIQELGRLTLIIAGKGTALKRIWKTIVWGPGCLAQLNKILRKGFFVLGLWTCVHLQNPRIGVLQKVKDPFPRILLHLRTPLTALFLSPLSNSNLKSLFNVVIMQWNLAWWTNWQLWTDLFFILYSVTSRI